MNDERILTDLKDKLDDIKSEISTKEREKKAILSRLKKEFKIESLEIAYKRLKEISKEIDLKQAKKQSLLKTAQERLENYG